MSDRPGFLRWRPDHPAPGHPAPGHPAEGHEGTSPASADSLAFVVARVADVSPCRVPRSSGTVWSYANRGRDAGSDQTTVCARLHSCTGVIPGPCVGAAVAVAERRADSPAQHLGSSACSAGERRSRPGRTKAYRRCEGPVEPATGAVFRRPAVVARPAKESPARSQGRDPWPPAGVAAPRSKAASTLRNERPVPTQRRARLVLAGQSFAGTTLTIELVWGADAGAGGGRLPAPQYAGA